MKINKRIRYVSSALILASGLASYRFYRMNYPPIPKIDKAKKRIACIGDSITYGQGVLERNSNSYPGILQTLVSNEIQILNYGLSGRTLLSTGDRPYTKESFYQASQNVNADIYIIMLGTNDAKYYNWNNKLFKSELLDFIDTYIAIAGRNNVYVMIPPKTFILEEKDHVAFDISESNLTEARAIIQDVSDELRVETIDIYSMAKDHPEWFNDGVHPNTEGKNRIAEFVFNSITIK